MLEKTMFLIADIISYVKDYIKYGLNQEKVHQIGKSWLRGSMLQCEEHVTSTKKESTEGKGEKNVIYVDDKYVQQYRSVQSYWQS